MNVKNQLEIIRVGRFWLDKSLIDEGYQVADVFGDIAEFELPELMDKYQKAPTQYLRCPKCDSISSVGENGPVCNHCEWGEDGKFINKRIYSCAA